MRVKLLPYFFTKKNRPRKLSRPAMVLREFPFSSVRSE